MVRALIGGLLLAVAGAACAATPSPPPEQVLGQADLTRAGGCADAFIYATTADDTMALTVRWSDAASRAQAEGEWREQVALPQPDVPVTLQFGRFLSEGFCTDVIMPDRPQVLGEVPAFAGELQISVEPEAGAEPFMPLGRATVTLRDVVFELGEGADAEVWRIELLELLDVEVGWFPG